MAEKFATKFDRTDVSVGNLKAVCTRNGWSTGAAGKLRNKGKSLIFTPEQSEWLRANAEVSRDRIHAEFRQRFPDAQISAAQIIGFRKRNGLKTGRSGYFEKGHQPWTKGKKIGSHPNSAKTQFKAGQTPVNVLPIGSERVRDDGYVEIKVELRNPYTNAPTRFVMKHKYLWEQKNGEVPKGHVLKSLDGDKANCDPSNWEPVPRGLLPRLNGKSGRDYDGAPAEIKPTILKIAKLEHAARNAIKEKDKVK
ncbi:HNH endonuclease [Sulfitobacter pseudonitzschiae]|uniref:HNH endonuclease n=1 Tax=Pseudosulfitobacter pseudonitzschiae TaxID=1402135 RepID=A0A9Q2NT04_9RHOB|nr:HNH endonuclease signature motif containing protein [Pseudosulfitobacter pseudonitzschiae]MBM2293785.1 HNH endonuclease [Pseudosulfitobacter pseudonitzschiae]MBM2298703.1 HNH endonuclease [Pseudosulfitobacter pseudonitzschiae]MBM2303617.1 HNH endonuclease [Pseudosulfitobacter pseudonitzschiae]MBM2313400.1 HNH endonuclease [Pseudosulfitobacter pseudonitzschiae]MBM2318313.1 HNH endonuclease [Pseudosulfitobacter pseudonitzschiae]